MAPKEKGEQIDFKSDSGGKKKMASGIWGRFIIKNFFPLSDMGKHGLGFTVNEPFSFFLFFQPPASFNPELSCREWLLS